MRVRAVVLECLVCVLLPILVLAVPFGSAVGKFSKSDRQYVQIMLRDVAADVQKHYYDPKLHGLDWDAQVAQARKNIETAESMDMAVSEIAALLDSLHDSHTLFLPPARNYTHDYGFRLKMIGDHCLVVFVRPGSDAEKKGLKVGDEVLTENEHQLSRATLPRLEYIYDALRPQPGFRLTLVGDGGQRELEVLAKVRAASVLKHYIHQGINQWVRDVEADRYYHRARFYEKGDGLVVVRLPRFVFSTEEVDRVLDKMRAHKGAVLDLRGNPGGFLDTLARFLGGMFEKDFKAYDRVERDKREEMTIVGHGHRAYTGRLTVLIDSDSASASELFARIIQIEKRGFILGDRSAGMVMEAVVYRHSVDYDYGAMITEANAIMTDGKSLEHAGIEPDFIVLPTAADLANHRDPALAKAAGLVGVKITPEEAGAMFPDEEPRED